MNYEVIPPQLVSKEITETYRMIPGDLALVDYPGNYFDGHLVLRTDLGFVDISDPCDNFWFRRCLDEHSFPVILLTDGLNVTLSGKEVKDEV